MAMSPDQRSSSSTKPALTGLRQAWEVLTGEDRLAERACFRTNLVIGCVAAVPASLTLFLSESPEDLPAPIWTAYLLVAVGVTLAAGWPIGALLPPLRRPLLFFSGLIISAAVPAYVAWMFVVLRTLPGPGRISHAPGLLALGAAYGFRLLLDFGPAGEATRRRWSKRTSWTGLALGGVLDVFAVGLMLWTFSRL